MSARKRRHRPGRQAPSRRPTAPAPEPPPVEQAGEADIASAPVDEAEPEQGPQEAGQEPTPPEVPEAGARETDAQVAEAQVTEAQVTEARVTAAAGPARRDAPAAAEAEEPESTAPMAPDEPEPAETAERETEVVETPERETETAEPEPEAAVAAEAEEAPTEAAEPEPEAARAAELEEQPTEAGPEEQPTEAETTVTASGPAQPQPRAVEVAEPVHPEREPEVGEPKATEPEAAEPETAEREAAELGPAAHEDRETKPEPDLREVAAADREPATRNGWAVLYQMGKPRLTKANLFAAVLAVGLGFAVVAQVQQTQNAGLESLREDELVRILDDFTQENLRLGNEIRDLESSRDRLISGAGTSSEALRAAQERADTLGILAGTRPARGEGIEMTIADPAGKITAPLLLDTLEELRDAGAEAVQIGGVRVVASSYFTDVDGGIELSGQRLERPYTILAIGDSSTLASAMKIPGGVVDTVRGKDGITTITEKPQIDITALHVVRPPQYAQPVPSPTHS